MGFRNFITNRITLNVIGGIIAVFALLVAVYYLLGAVTKHNQEITVPDLTNMSIEEASAVLSASKMKLDVVDSVYVKRMGKGLIYRQNPVAGSKVKEGRCIHLTINAKNSKKVTMPNLVGYSMRQAKAELRSKGLILGRLIYEKDMATNNVLRQLYYGREIAPGTTLESESTVDLVLGLNSSDNLTYIPDITGMKYLSAVDAVHNNYLNVNRLIFDGTVKDYSDSLNAVVYRQNPVAVPDSAFVMGSSVVIYLTMDESKVPPKGVVE